MATRTRKNMLDVDGTLAALKAIFGFRRGFCDALRSLHALGLINYDTRRAVYDLIRDAAIQEGRSVDPGDYWWKLAGCGEDTPRVDALIRIRAGRQIARDQKRQRAARRRPR